MAKCDEGPSDGDTDTSCRIHLSETEPLSVEDMERLRSSTKLALHRLREVSDKQRLDDPTVVPSWIRPAMMSETLVEDDAQNNGHDTKSASSVTSQNRHDRYLRSRCDDGHFFDMYGFLVVENFCNDTEVRGLKREMRELVERNWHPGGPGRDDQTNGDGLDEEVTTFGTDATSNSNRGDYFLDSANKVSYFAEPQALMASPITGTKHVGNGRQHSDLDGADALNDDDSKNLTTKTVLRPEYINDKVAALNKAGHGMHCLQGSHFHEYCCSAKLKDLVMTTLGYQDPIVPQSMYIFKQSQIGGTVHSHQDSTFLYTTPRQSCLGVWLALDDATLHNGCLWVRPASHTEPVRRQFCRNPEYFNDSHAMSSTAGTPPQKLIFKKHNDDPNVTWEGALPESVTVEPTVDATIHTFLPVEVRAGDVVVFCGTLDHFSLPNLSSQARHTFQLHLVEGPDVGIQWSPENWLQYPPGSDFVRLKECSKNCS